MSVFKSVGIKHLFTASEIQQVVVKHDFDFDIGTHSKLIENSSEMNEIFVNKYSPT